MLYEAPSDRVLAHRCLALSLAFKPQKVTFLFTGLTQVRGLERKNRRNHLYLHVAGLLDSGLQQRKGRRMAASQCFISKTSMSFAIKRLTHLGCPLVAGWGDALPSSCNITVTFGLILNIKVMTRLMVIMSYKVCFGIHKQLKILTLRL